MTNSFIISLLVFVGLVLMFISGPELREFLTHKARRSNNEQKLLSKLRRAEILKTKDGRFRNIQRSVTEVITEFEYINTVTYLVLTVITAIFGFIIGQVWKNTLVSLVLAGVGATAPYFLLKFLLRKRKREKDEKLVVVMGDIQSELVQTKDFFKAVKNKLPNIRKVSEVLYKHFKWYVDQIMLFTPDDNIPFMEELAERVNNYFFTQYMRLAIGFEKGQSSLVHTMTSIPQEYAEYLDRMKKHAKKVSSYNKDFATKVIALPIVVGFIKVVSKDFYTMLTENFFGQLTLFLVIVVYIVCARLYTKYNKDVEYEG